jgi:hypothetical protein
MHSGRIKERFSFHKKVDPKWVFPVRFFFRQSFQSQYEKKTRDRSVGFGSDTEDQTLPEWYGCTGLEILDLAFGTPCSGNNRQGDGVTHSISPEPVVG